MSNSKSSKMPISKYESDINAINGLIEGYQELPKDLAKKTNEVIVPDEYVKDVVSIISPGPKHINPAPIDYAYLKDKHNNDDSSESDGPQKTNQDKLHSIVFSNHLVAESDSDSYSESSDDDKDDWEEHDEKYKFISNDVIGKFYVGSITAVCLFVLYRMITRGGSSK